MVRGWVLPHLGLLAVLGVALATRLVYLHWFKTFPAGDVFNFITIAEKLLHGLYSPDEKRLPFYPLLVLLAHTFLEWETASLVVAVVASLFALVLLYALGKTLGFSKTALLAVLLVFQAHPEVLIASGRGFADTTFLALFPASLLALFRTRTWKGAILAGVLLGCLSLTRYEGVAAATAVLPLWVLFPRTLPRRLPLIAVGTFLLTLTPYLLLSHVNNRSAFGAGYAEETAQVNEYGAGDLSIVRKRALEIWERAGLIRTWNIPVAIVREITEDPFATPRILSSRLAEGGEVIALLASLGIIALFVQRQWHALLFLSIAFAAITLPIAWYRPLLRYEAFVYPFTLLLAAAGITAGQRLLRNATIAGGRSGRIVRVSAGTILLVTASGLWTMKFAADARGRQEKHNGREYAYYQAIHAARKLPGKILFERAEIPMEFYFGERGIYLLDQFVRTGVPADDILRRLRAENVQYVVVSQAHAQAFPFLNDPSVQHLSAFEWPRPGGDVSRAMIYQILN